MVNRVSTPPAPREPLPASFRGPRRARPRWRFPFAVSSFGLTVRPLFHAMTTQLDQLKQITKVVADTGDFETMRAYKPLDATTNPSLILAAASKPEYAHLVDKAVTDRKNSGLAGAKQLDDVMDNVLVNFGVEILK